VGGRRSRARQPPHLFYRQLQEDPKYSDDYKSAAAWEKYQDVKAKIGVDAPRAREALEKQARSARQSAIPMPLGKSPTTVNLTEIVAAQNHQAALARRIDRLNTSGKGPFKPDRLGILKAEYRKGIETGGKAGAIVCRGVIGAAEELGLDIDSVVDDFRRDRHRESLERAQHADRLSLLISKEVPEPPFSRPGARRRGGDMHTGGVPRVLTGGEGKKPLVAGGGSRRRRPWR